MEATDQLKLRLRAKLGESIPSDGDASESFFTDAQIKDMLEAASSLNAAILDGWETKMAHWANLVTVVDGASSRELTKLMEHAEAMIKYYGDKVNEEPGGNSFGRTRIGKIVRR